MILQLPSLEVDPRLPNLRYVCPSPSYAPILYAKSLIISLFSPYIQPQPRNQASLERYRLRRVETWTMTRVDVSSCLFNFGLRMINLKFRALNSGLLDFQFYILVLSTNAQIRTPDPGHKNHSIPFLCASVTTTPTVRNGIILVLLLYEPSKRFQGPASFRFRQLEKSDDTKKPPHDLN